MYQVKMSSFPNGETRLVFSTCGASGKKSSSPLASPSAEHMEKQSGVEVVDSSASPSTPHLTLALNSMGGISPVAKRSKTGRFTLDAKRKILRAGGALDVFDVKPSNCLLLTGTLPGSTKAAMNEIPKHSGYIVNRLKMWIRERYRENQFSFYCWELQKRGALHIHYCVYVPDLAASERIIDEFKEFWIRLLSDISDKTGVDLFEKSYGGSHRFDTENVQADAQRCRKSVAAYMSKYVSKEAGRGHRSRYPSRWSGVSRPLTALIRSLTREEVAVVPGYRQGRTLYEDVRQYLTGAPGQCHTYPHKVGIGETRVAYYSSDKELQECQYHHASSRMTSSRFCQQSSSLSPFIADISFLLNQMSMIVQQAYGYLSSSSICSSSELGHTLRRLFQRLNTVTQTASSLRNLKREVTGLITSSLTSTCNRFISSVPELYQESLRIVIRSLWHLAERTREVEALNNTLRIVTRDLTREVNRQQSSTTRCDTVCDADGEAKQLALCW